MRVAATIALVVLAAAAPGASAQIAGPAVAIDGDTLDVGGQRLRLYGIDAPETGQTCGDGDGRDWDCGAAATIRLAELIAPRDLSCVAVERDRYGRIVARCAAGGIDVNTALVREGLAWAYARYSAAFIPAEAEARAAGRGVWRGPAQVAWDWRRANGWQAAAGRAASAEPAARMAAPDGNCTIKGNVNGRGERIYHTPASRWYDRVTVDPGRGQRWFCNEREAEAAGWRRAGGRRSR